MSDFIKVVVDNFTQVNEHILLDADFGVLVNLDAGGVHDTQITHVILAVLANDHQLRLPEFLVVRDLVVVRITFTDLEDTT